MSPLPRRVPRGLPPRDARAEGASPRPWPPEGCAGASPLPPLRPPGGVQAGASLPTLPKCSEVAVPPVPRGQCPPGGHLQVLPPGLGRDPRHDCQSTDGSLGSPQAPEGSACSQAWSPGPAPVAWARPPHHLPGEGASFLSFTFRRYLEGIYRWRRQPPPPRPPQGPHFWTKSPMHPFCLQTIEILGGWDGGTQAGGA